MNYRWNIKTLEVKYQLDQLTDVVTHIHWELIGEDDGTQANQIGVVKLNEPNTQNFLQFDNLSQKVVEEWLINSLGAEKISQLKQQIEANIQSKKMPVSGLKTPPWLLENKE